MNIIKKIFGNIVNISLKTHNVYPEIKISDNELSFTACLISLNGTVVESFAGDCKDRAHGTEKATKLLQSAAKSYLKKGE